jgi:hypothetical protein
MIVARSPTVKALAGRYTIKGQTRNFEETFGMMPSLIP